VYYTITSPTWSYSSSKNTKITLDLRHQRPVCILWSLTITSPTWSYSSSKTLKKPLTSDTKDLRVTSPMCSSKNTQITFDLRHQRPVCIIVLNYNLANVTQSPHLWPGRPALSCMKLYTHAIKLALSTGESLSKYRGITCQLLVKYCHNT
jgi:hypothetical protein